LRCTTGGYRRRHHHNHDPDEGLAVLLLFTATHSTTAKTTLKKQPPEMSDPDLFHRILGLAGAVVVALLTLPALIHVSKTSTVLGRGYVQLGGDEDVYEDRDGIATEDSIRAFSDTRPRVAAWLGAVLGLGASIAARVLVLKGAEHTDVLFELTAWAEPACWVRPPHLRLAMSV
jgi:hypothetical protein